MVWLTGRLGRGCMGYLVEAGLKLGEDVGHGDCGILEKQGRGQGVLLDAVLDAIIGCECSFHSCIEVAVVCQR